MIDNTFIRALEYQYYLEEKENISPESVVFVEDKERLIAQGKEYQFVPSGGKEGQVLTTTEDGLDWKDISSSGEVDLSDYYTKEEVDDLLGQEYDDNGHEYVDLGLPSGKLWAKYNLSTDDGKPLYFAWGETKGYTRDQIMSGERTFNEDSLNKELISKYNLEGKEITLPELELEDDAAHVHMGGDWRMPTKEDFEELIQNCNILVDPSCVTFTSKINSEKLIIDCQGFAVNNKVTSDYEYNGHTSSTSGNILSRTLGLQYNKVSIFGLYFFTDYGNSSTTNFDINNPYPKWGYSIRGILEAPSGYLTRKEAKDSYLTKKEASDIYATKEEAKADWNANEGQPGFIKNKPVVEVEGEELVYSEKNISLTYNKNGYSYTDLLNKFDFIENDIYKIVVDDKTYNNLKCVFKQNVVYIITDGDGINDGIYTGNISVYYNTSNPVASINIKGEYSTIDDLKIYHITSVKQIDSKYLPIVQETGDSETSIMSQKAVTDALDKFKEFEQDYIKKSEINNYISEYLRTTGITINNDTLIIK